MVLAIAGASPVAAQDAVPAPATRSQLRWWHGAVALGGYALLTNLDGGIKQFAIDNRSTTSDNVSSVARKLGQPEIYASVGLGILASGLISGDREVRDAGIRVSSALAMTGVLVTAAKFTAGRSRPSEPGSDADDFSPFSGRTSAPSGHAAIAFALATSLSDEIRNPWATATLYTLAAGTAWSRVNDNVHWFSDIIAGAALGIVTAKFANGKLAIFGLNAPTFSTRGHDVAISWQGEF